MTELSIHQRLFLSRVTKFSSHVCAVLYYERERERRRVSPRNQHRGPVVGCAIWTWRIVEESCVARRKKDDERGVRSSLRGWLSSLYHITIPNVSPGLCETFIFFSSFIISKYIVQLNAKVTISRFENIPNSLRPNFHNISKRILIINTAERRSWIITNFSKFKYSIIE